MRWTSEELDTVLENVNQISAEENVFVLNLCLAWCKSVM